MKAKKFSKKLLSLFLAILMGLSCFTGALTAYAAVSSETEYHDSSLASNILAWAETTDEQTCTALLDYADDMLAGVNYHLQFSQSIVVATISIDATIDSIDGIFDLIDQVDSILDSYAGLVGGDVKNIDLSYVTGYTRETKTSKEIVMGIAQLLFYHSNNDYGKAILKNFLRGTLDIGLVGNFLDLYDTLGGLLGMDDGYESNLVYNVVQKLFVGGFYTEGTTAYTNAMALKIDDLAFQLMDEFLFDTIENKDQKLFLKDFTLKATDTADDKLLEAFQIVWNDVLEYLFGTISYDKFGYDDAYYTYTHYDTADYEANPEATPVYPNADVTVDEWIAADYVNIAEQFGFDKDAEGNPVDVTAESVRESVIDALTFDKTTLNTKDNAWMNIDATNLFNKLLYSNVADALGIDTGVLNLCIKEKYNGADGFVDAFNFDFTGYETFGSGINDFLVSLVNVLFPDMAADGVTLATSKSVTSYSNLVPNILKMVQYVADQTDANILAQFYSVNGATATLTETNIEDAMVPFLISLVNQIYDVRMIHDSEWNACDSAEDVAFVCFKEYLSYVLPDKDYSVLPGATIVGGSYQATLEETLLPMARDAVAFVLGSSVPVIPDPSKPTECWDVYTASVNDSTTLFDILNYVVCYYADDKGVAELLGFVDYKGCGTISRSNDLWTNLDIVINNLCPMLGTLISTDPNHAEGSIDSYDLIYNGIVKGALNIADTKEYNGKSYAGVSYFIEVLGSSFNTTIMNDTPIINIVYNFLADLVNFFLGARDSVDGYGDVVPATNSATPFDDLLQADVIAGAESASSDVGVLGRIITRAYWALGGNYGREGNAPTDTAYTGLMYVVTAVNNFIPAFCPQIGEHALGTGETSLSNATTTSASSGDAFSGVNLTFKNASYGLNRFYRDINNNIQQDGRYYMNITGIDFAVADSCASNISVAAPSKTLIAPEESITMAVTGTINGTGIVSYTVTYNVVDSTGASLGADYEGLTSTVYQGVTTNKDWFTTTYYYNSDGGMYYFPSTYETDKASQNISNVTKSTAAYAKSSYLTTLLPTVAVVYTSNLSNIDNYSVRTRNTSNGTFGSDRSVDGVYSYSTDTVYDDISGGNKTLSSVNAIPCFDKLTGDILNYDYLDYYDGDLNTWVRGNFTESDLSTKVSTGTNITKSRIHVSYTLQEAIDAGIVYAYHYNATTQLYEYMYLQTGGGTNYDTVLSNISCQTNIDGIYFKMKKVTVVKGKSSYSSFLGYDGETEITAEDSATLNICFYNSSISATTTLPIIVADDSDITSLTEDYNSALNYASNYKANDFTGNEYAGLTSALESAVSAQLNMVNATADSNGNILTNTASSIASNKQYTAKWNSTTNEYGDVAYIPASTSNSSGISQLLLDEAYTNAQGYYFYDANCTIPIYTNVEVTDPSQTFDSVMLLNDEEKYGKDNDNKYHLVNEPLYETEWDTTTYAAPYEKYTSTQATNAAGDLLYRVIQFVYRDANNEKTKSSGVWVAKLADTEYSVIPNSGTENRGIYKQNIDKLNYTLGQCKDNVDPTVASSVRTLVTDVRQGMNNVNFDVVTYEKMVKIAQKAEAMYSYDSYNNYYAKDDVDEDGEPVDGAVAITSCLSSEFQDYLDTVNGELAETDENYKKASDFASVEDRTKTVYETTASSTQINMAIDEFQKYMDLVVTRGYIGEKLESEIVDATGLNYTALTPSTSEDATTIAAASTKYGSIVDGVMSNTTAEGKQAYTADSWTAYIDALAAAIEVATTGNSPEYAYKSVAYYVASDVDNYTAQPSDCYTAKVNLMCAENNLEEYVEPVADGYSVTGTVVVMTTATATTGTIGLEGVDVIIDGQTVATTDANGQFVIDSLADGTYTATLSYAYGYDRTVTIVVNGADITFANAIPMINCDFNRDGFVKSSDIQVVVSGLSEYTTVADLNKDGYVKSSDIAILLSFLSVGTITSSIYGNVTIQ